MADLDKERERFSAPNPGMPLPPIFHYWSNRYLGPKLRAVAGAKSPVDFYAQSLLALKKPKLRILSVGSGAAVQDVKVAQALHAAGRLERYECFELAPPRVAQANAAIAAAGLSAVMVSIEADATARDLEGRYDGVVANQCLHHFVELERLFDKVAAHLAPGGLFVTNDIIGRNGHQRWPETLAVIASLWDQMPLRYKRRSPDGRVDKTYDDRDYSKNHNEGVRAQDILPLLIERFQFHSFVVEGGIIDPFIERCYGPNLSPENAQDTAFIDHVASMNETLIDAGLIKPTMMLAAMGMEKGGEVKRHRHWTPEFCVRPTAPRGSTFPEVTPAAS